MQLKEFLVKAKTSTYAKDGEGGEIKLSDGGRQLKCEKENYKYQDTYYGVNPFSGEELVWKDEKIIWSMNYYGKTESKEISKEEVYKFLRKAMKLVEEKRPFRGPDNFKEEDFEYLDESEGDIKSFKGIEKIYYKGKEIYRLNYHGGIVE